MGERFYFAYGSNMDETQMEGRCPGAILSGIASCSGYRFLINARGVATMVPDLSREVYGILWSITHDHEESLDRYEGVKNGYYRKEEVPVEMGETKQSALVYVATNSAPGAPRTGYLELIVDAANRHGLPGEYVEYLRSLR